MIPSKRGFVGRLDGYEQQLGVRYDLCERGHPHAAVRQGFLGALLTVGEGLGLHDLAHGVGHVASDHVVPAGLGGERARQSELAQANEADSHPLLRFAIMRARPRISVFSCDPSGPWSQYQRLASAA